MPMHEIEATLPAHQVVNTDLRITVKSDGRTLGVLAVSKGTIDWTPARRKTISLEWERFADVMDRYRKGQFG
jgi:hypothetical protein